MLFPKLFAQHSMAGVQHIGVFDGLVAVIILGVHTNDGRLDTQVDVFGYQRDARASVQRLQSERLRQDFVVIALTGQVRRQVRCELPRLKKQTPQRRFLALVAVGVGGQCQTGIDLIGLHIAHQIIEKTADLPRIARGFRQAFFIGVEFFEYHHRQVDIVLFEAKDRRRIVHQHVGIEYEQPAFAGRFTLHELRAASSTFLLSAILLLMILPVP